MSIRNMFRSLSLRSTSSSSSSSTSSRSSASRPSIAPIFSTGSTSSTPRAANGAANSKITMTGVPEFEEVACDETKEILVMASLKAPLFEVSPEEKRAPIDICCVIDESGSMEGEKLELAKKAMEFVIDNLDDQDTLAIVCYDSDVRTVLTFTKMTTNGKSQAKATVAKMHTKGSTNLSGGLFEGLAQAQKRTSKNDVCSVLLFTDGQANEGLQDTASITAEMEKRLSQFSKKPSVFTFGFGSDHNQDMLRGIAECGGGMYYYLADADKIPLSFADCLGGLQSVVGQNLVLEVAGSTNVRILKSLNPKYKLLKGTLPCDKISLELGDIYSEEGRDIIFLVELPKAEESDAEVECVRLKLTYFNVLTTEDEVLEVAASIKRPKKVTNGKGNAQLDQQRNRLQAAEAMEKSKALADKGDLQGAKVILQKTKESIQNSTTAKETFSNNLMLELDQCADDMRDTQHYCSEGNKKVSRKAQAHYYQRSNKLEESEISFYETSAKVASKSKSKGIW